MSLATTLRGIRVLDLTRNLAGPFCTMTLGDLGAEVTKIEHPAGGDDTRRWRPPEWDGRSATYLAANRNKRSVAVNLDDPGGREIVRALAASADVVVESFKPGALSRRGLGYEELAETNPRLVYCSISAYGDRGPKSELPGYDPILQADTGIMDLTGDPDADPVRLGIGAIDLGAAIWSVVGIQAALADRERTGRGAHVRSSLFETATWWLSYHLAGYLGTGVAPRRQGTATPFISPYEVFDTADHRLMLAAPNDELFRRLAGELGLPELVTDPRFTTNPDRVAHRFELCGLLAPALRRRPAGEWEKRLQARSIPCSRVRSIADLATDSQLAALDLLRAVPGSPIDGLRLVDTPITVDGARGDRGLPPPELGEHTLEVLEELGVRPDRVAELRERGVITCPAGSD
ncbi:CaiB/BaiF CoA transferase family protein [Prauserella cavernicola]|uniref:CoA transferase n=1 Tax=Prauserella cavernicola TaxID=2800127 RepID=A0A934QYM0_9PSEU|nr:CoA transferase [Prauserella cavernicola]MBK1789150.1 CoA transferase [Prauserella cavernicola]